MVSILDILAQRTRNELTPRLNDLSRQELIDEINVRVAQVDEPDIQSSDELSVKQADTYDRSSGAIRDIIDSIIGGGSDGGEVLDFNIEFGKASSGSELAWYEVQLEQNFSTPPTIIGVIESRDGEANVEASFNPPEQDGPNDKSVSTDRFRFSDSIEEQFKDRTREAGRRSFDRAENQIRRNTRLPDWLENPLQDYLVDVVDDFFRLTLGYGDFARRGEGVVESIMGAAGEFVGSAIDNGLDSRRDEINDVLDRANQLKDEANDIANWSSEQLSNQAETAYNGTPDALYSALGAPSGIKIAPFHHKNVSRNSFEYLGYEGGVDIHWVAIG